MWKAFSFAQRGRGRVISERAVRTECGAELQHRDEKNPKKRRRRKETKSRLQEHECKRTRLHRAVDGNHSRSWLVNSEMSVSACSRTRRGGSDTQRPDGVGTAKLIQFSPNMQEILSFLAIQKRRKEKVDVLGSAVVSLKMSSFLLRSLTLLFLKWKWSQSRHLSVEKFCYIDSRSSLILLAESSERGGPE